MSEDSKKINKQTFFRINEKGELTSTEKSVEQKESAKEPSELAEPNQFTFDNSPTEVRAPEPIISTNENDFTHSGILAEPQALSISVSDSSENESQVVQESEPAESVTDASIEHHTPTVLEDPMAEANPSLVSDSDNMITLKSYISLKEKEVADLKEQQKQYQSVLIKLKRTHSELSQTNVDLQRELEAAKTQELFIKKEMTQLREKYESEIALLKNDFEQQRLQNGSFQEQLQDLNRQKNVWKEKIADDLRKIKIKEKELENRHELLKKDTETLLDSKDQQILELKKKTDAFELELEALEERLRTEHAILNSIESKKRRLIETLKLAISLLEQLDSTTDIDEQRKTG